MNTIHPLKLILIFLFIHTTQAFGGVEILVNGTIDTDDDYLCWSPVPLKVHLTGTDSNIQAITLRTENLIPDSGEVGFQQLSNKPSSTIFLPQAMLTVPVPTGGEVSNLWVGGTRLSKNQKDTIIIVGRSDGTEIGRLPVMVRVRQNAEKLSNDERNRFLNALATIHQLGNGGISSLFSKHQRAHGEGFSVGIHGGPQGIPLFLAWHRSFLLNLERELQSIDPSVALPYWRFDKVAPRIFSESFMGRIAGNPVFNPDAHIVKWSNSNPINGWEMFDGQGAMTRTGNGDILAPIPASRLEDLFNVPSNEVYLRINGALESRYHNRAHSTIGGWLTTLTSPRDPLFFLLHANVDRAWASWQKRHNRFDDTAAIENDYHATGSYPGPGIPNRFRKGSYANDRMWPWIPIGDGDGTPDPGDDWPNIRYDMPQGNGIATEPTPAQMVDYLDVDGDGRDIGACYDDVLFVDR